MYPGLNSKIFPRIWLVHWWCDRNQIKRLSEAILHQIRGWVCWVLFKICIEIHRSEQASGVGNGLSWRQAKCPLFQRSRQGSYFKALRCRRNLFCIGLLFTRWKSFSLLHMRDGLEQDHGDVKQLWFWQMPACKKTRYFRRNNVELVLIGITLFHSTGFRQKPWLSNWKIFLACPFAISQLHLKRCLA